MLYKTDFTEWSRSNRLRLLLSLIFLCNAVYAGAADSPYDLPAHKVQTDAQTLRAQPLLYESNLKTYSFQPMRLEQDSGLGAAVRRLPYSMGSSNNENESNGGSGAASANLRGMGRRYTATLIDGLPAGGEGAIAETPGGWRDLNLYPEIGLAGIEIFMGPQSTANWWERPAGSINIDLPYTFVGKRMEFEYGNTTDRDMSARRAGLMYGVKHKSTYINVAYEAFRKNALATRDRELTGSADYRRFGGSDQRSGFFAGRVNRNGTNMVLLDGVNVPASVASYRNRDGTSDLFNFNAFAPAVPEQSRQAVWLTLQHEFESKHRLRMALMRSVTQQNNGFGPAIFGSSTHSDLLTPARQSPHMPFAAMTDLDGFFYRSLELGNWEITFTREATRFQVQLDGDYSEKGRWGFDYAYSGLDTERKSKNIADADLLTQQILSGRFNPFALNFAKGVNNGVAFDNQAALEAARTTAIIDFEEDFHFLQGYVTHATDFGSVDFRLYLNRESVEQVPDSRFTSNDLLFGSTVTAYNAERSVATMDSTLTWGPESLPLTWQLTPSLAIVDDSGTDAVNGGVANAQSEFVPAVKSSFSVELHPQISFLLSGATGIRPAALSSKYGGSISDFPRLNDPTGNTPAGTAVATTVTSNPKLESERWWVFETGVSLRSKKREREGWSSSLLYFRNEVEDAVANSAQFIVDENFRNGSFGTSVFRNGSGQLTFVSSNFRNLAKSMHSGLEFRGGAWRALSKGQRVDLDVSLVRMLSYTIQSTDSSPETSFLGRYQSPRSNAISPGSIPKYKAELTTSYSNGPWTAAITSRYISKLDDEATTTVNRLPREIEAWYAFDFSLERKLAYKSSQVSLLLGLENILDNPPPFAAGAFADGHDRSLYSLAGRQWNARLRIDF